MSYSDSEKIANYLNSDKFQYVGAKNDIVKLATSLIKGSKKSNMERYFVVEGLWAHEKICQIDLEVEAFLFCPEFIFSSEAEEIVTKLFDSAKKSYLISKKTFLKLSERDGPDGFISICKLPQYSLDDLELRDNNLLVILDGLEQPGNIGTIMRTIDGANGDGVIICNRRARITHPKTIKGSMGANFVIPIIEVEIHDLIEWLIEKNFRIFLTDTRADKKYYEADYSGRIAIVAGSERYGISQPWYEVECEKIFIPMLGSCDSLNVSVATSIVTYEAAIKQNVQES